MMWEYKAHRENGQQIRVALRFVIDCIGVTQSQLEAANVKKLTDRYRNNGTLRGCGDR